MKLYRLFLVAFLVLSACNPASATPVSPTNENLTSPAPQSNLSEPTALIGKADIIFTDGDILTMDPSNPKAQAIAIHGNNILGIGTNENLAPFRGERTILINLAGRTMMPGFVDAHSHMFNERLLHDQDPLPDQQMAIEYGVTTTAEFYVDQSILNKLIALADAGKLRMRVNTYLLDTTNCGEVIGDWWKAYKPNQQIAPNLFVRGIKIFTDGGSCKIPAMSVDYPAGVGKGDLFFTQEQLSQIVAEVQTAGFQVAIHALGDRALEQSQNAIAAALNGQPNTFRHRIEHNTTIRPDLLTRYTQIGVVPIILGAYPTCIRTTDESKFKYLISPEYGAWDWPWRALTDSNPDLPIAWQADYPLFGNISPIYHMWGMVTRKAINTDGSICNPPDWIKAGALRIEEVLPMMTRNSAYALFFDKEVGTLQPGKFADLVILSDSPLSVESDSIKDIAVLMTMIDGKVEYCAAGFESTCPSASFSDVEPASVSVTASSSLPDSPPSAVLDGNSETIWNSGAGPEQWIQIDLGAPSTLSTIRLVVSQFPAGETVHQIWVGAEPNNLTLVHEFNGFTTDPDILEFTQTSPLTKIQFIKIITTQSPSWVAWREIEVIGE